MTIIRPRLNDFHGLPFLQEELALSIKHFCHSIGCFIFNCCKDTNNVKINAHIISDLRKDCETVEII